MLQKVGEQNVIFGHHHISQKYTKKKFPDGFVDGFAVGKLCGNADYAMVNQWQTGFAYAELKNGHMEVSNYEIRQGQIIC